MRTAPISARYGTDICPRSASISPGNRSSEWRYRFESLGHTCGSTSFSTNVSRTGCWRAPVSEREPIVTEREPAALLVVSEREPKSRAVCEPGGLCLQAATPTVQNPMPFESDSGRSDIICNQAFRSRHTRPYAPDMAPQCTAPWTDESVSQRNKSPSWKLAPYQVVSWPSGSRRCSLW
jgi:hypothetical protein